MTALISAHRCGSAQFGAGENTAEALEAACWSAAEYIEFDVQRCADGTLVLFHNSVAGPDRRPVADLTFAEFSRLTGHHLEYATALTALRDAGKKAHIDLKFTTAAGAAPGSHEIAAVAQALSVLGPGNFIVTTYEDESVGAIRAWALPDHPDLLVGLSLGRSVKGLSPWRAVKLVASEFFPKRRYTACQANLVVSDHRLARFTVARWARRRRLPLLIWTVDAEADMSRWLRRQDVWLITTNYPDRAVALRDRLPS